MSKPVKKYIKTKKGVVSTIYFGQKGTSKRRGHRPPEYSRESLQGWLFSQALFHELYEEWKQSGYMKRLKPSIDRKYDDIHYCMSNIQLMTWGENQDKSYKHHKEGIKKYDQKEVAQYSIGGELLHIYHSVNQAARENGIKQANISKVCVGTRKTTGGFVWKFTQGEINE